MWHKYLPLATFAHNTFNSPNLANHSPYELVLGRKHKLLLDLEMDPEHESIRNTQRIFASLKKKTRISTQTLTGISNEKISIT